MAMTCPHCKQQFCEPRLNPRVGGAAIGAVLGRIVARHWAGALVGALAGATVAHLVDEGAVPRCPLCGSAVKIVL